MDVRVAEKDRQDCEILPWADILDCYQSDETRCDPLGCLADALCNVTHDELDHPNERPVIEDLRNQGDKNDIDDRKHSIRDREEIGLDGREPKLSE